MAAQTPEPEPVGPIDGTTWRGPGFSDWDFRTQGYPRPPIAWWDAETLVVRWWYAHSCDQRLSPRAHFDGDGIRLSMGTGPETRCGTAVSEFRTRFEGVPRAAEYRVRLDRGTHTVAPTPTRPAHLPRPRRLRSGGVTPHHQPARNRPMREVLDPWAQ